MLVPFLRRRAALTWCGYSSDGGRDTPRGERHVVDRPLAQCVMTPMVPPRSSPWGSSCKTVAPLNLTAVNAGANHLHIEPRVARNVVGRRGYRITHALDELVQLHDAGRREHDLEIVPGVEAVRPW